MKRRKWTKEIIVERLRAWHAEGVPAKSLWRMDSAMTSRSTAMFGSWRKALAAAGIESAHSKWPPEIVIERLRMTRGRGTAIDSALANAAAWRFGTLRAACEAAGVPCSKKYPQHHPDWDRDKAIEAIRQRHDEGYLLRATVREDRPLYLAARRLFGKWSAARAAAGHPIPRNVVLSAEEVIQKIRACVGSGGSLPQLRLNDPLLLRSAQNHFGTWTDAVDAAGFEKMCRKRWDRQRVIVAIQKRQTDGHELSKTWRDDKLLFGAAIQHFGGWRKAIKVAGFEPIKTERWSKQRVIERLSAWAERSPDTVLVTSDQRLSSAILRLFGSYETAFEAAGVELCSRWWTKDRVIAAIQDRYVSGHPPHRVGLGDERLAGASRRCFGSWAAAVEAAGLIDQIPINPSLRYWNKQKVIAEIRAWHDSGHRLAEVRYKYQALFNAAKSHFGGWNKAIIAADLEPDRRFYTKAEILDQIRRKHKAGESLSSRHPDNRNLVKLTIRHFGSWRKGLAASGVLNFNRKQVDS